MVSPEITAVIAAASAIAGGAIVAVSNYKINRARAADARKAELRRALIDLGDVVSRIDLQLRREPAPGNMTQAINEAVAKYFPRFEHATELIHRRLLEPNLDELAAAIARTLSIVAMVLAPAHLLPAVEQLTEAMDGAERRDEEWWRRWNSARNNYFLRCREVVGHSVPEPSADEELADEQGSAES